MPGSLLKITGLFFTIILLFPSCVKDEAGECAPSGESILHLSFVYDYNRDGVDKLREQVRRIALYLFDSHGHLYVSQDIHVYKLGEDNTVSFELPAGDYSAVAWGNTDSGDYSLGQNGLMQGMSVSVRNEAGIVTSNCEHLFHGLLHINHAGEKDMNARVSMRKNTNTVNIVYEGIDSKDNPEEVIEVILRGTGSMYAHDNTPGGDILTYHPLFETDGHIKAVSVVQRITDNCDMRLVSSQQGYQEAFIDEPLTALIKEKYTGGDFARYLDTEDEFTITVTLKKGTDGKYILVSVKVNDWDAIIYDGIEI